MYDLLNNAPQHDTDEFLTYLRDNNPVVADTPHWLVIENCKYHQPDAPWLTAFSKHDLCAGCWTDLDPWKEWEWKKKTALVQTVKRFHLHLIKK